MNVNGPLFPPGVLPASVTARASRPVQAPEREPAVANASAPTLWDVLTAEEREFFAEQAALGPLTYGRGRSEADANPAPTGQRVDRTG